MGTEEEKQSVNAFTVFFISKLMHLSRNSSKYGA
jgi:hypothetical protein